MKRSGGRNIAAMVVTLRPAARFSGTRQPAADELAAMHHKVHAECFIAKSVRTEVRCEPVFPIPDDTEGAMS